MYKFKLAERVSKYTTTEIFHGPKAAEKLAQKIRSPFYKSHSELPPENGEHGLYEVVMDQKKVTDDKLVHVGVGILQQSKLLFLRFVQFLRTYLKPGSYQPIYCGKLKKFSSYLQYIVIKKHFQVNYISKIKTPTLWLSRCQNQKSFSILSQDVQKWKRCFSR